MGSLDEKIRYSEKFYSKKFSEETSKKAYLKACKWLAKYVLSKSEFANIDFGIKKIDESTFQLNLYAVLSEEELRERHCNICKEIHSSFFYSEETNCEWCKLKAYHKRADEQLEEKVKYYRDKLDKYVEGEW